MTARYAAPSAGTWSANQARSWRSKTSSGVGTGSIPAVNTAYARARTCGKYAGSRRSRVGCASW
ncbi:hypothetical protein ACFQGN_15235 [Streptomyces goshikiensis]|uniref:hypothetical protein n=1 Tax=Streptomyces goshikiensis TaxID=1942 RepID=UPI0036217973